MLANGFFTMTSDLSLGFCGLLQVFRAHSTDDLINVEQRLDAAFDLGHAEDVIGFERRAKIRRGFDVRGGEIHNLLDGVHDEAP